MGQLRVELRRAGVKSSELQRHAAELRAARKMLYATSDGEFLRLPSQSALLREIRGYCRARPSQLTDVVQLGIGGSSLGAQALCKALLPARHNERVGPGGLRYHFPDNVDPEGFGALLETLDPRRTLVHVVSKSGRTLETLAQLGALRACWGKKTRLEHFVVTTEPQSELSAYAEKVGIPHVLRFPEHVCGRFSVFTASGLLVPALCGVPIGRILGGARAMEARCRQDPLVGPAGRLAAIHFTHDRSHGRAIHVEMIYADALLPLGEWFRQLWAESLGKGGRGPTPVTARGATDQHSQIQLYVDGPDDKLYTLVRVDRLRTRRVISRRAEPPLIRGRDLGEIFAAEAEGTREALLEAGRPLVELRLPSIGAAQIGELLMLQQYQTALAGALYGVNPFEQPGVEAGKRATLRVLERNRRKRARR